MIGNGMKKRQIYVLELMLSHIWYEKNFWLLSAQELTSEPKVIFFFFIWWIKQKARNHTNWTQWRKSVRIAKKATDNQNHVSLLLMKRLLLKRPLFNSIEND